MQRITRRMLLLLVLMGLMLVGTLVFAWRYAVSSDEWVVFSGSPHVYSGGNLSLGIVTDRTGTVLLDSTNGRRYADDSELRKATMHLLGDRYGYISAPVLNDYADELIGFSKITGLHTLSDTTVQAKLSISASAQKTALAALAGRKGTIGVYNYETGEILCAVTSPTYDPDAMPDIEGDTTGTYGGVYLNRFFQTTYVPGSIFKIVTTAAALEELPDAQTKTFFCEGSCRIGADTINCNGTHYTQTLSQALANSCNVAFAQLAVELGADVMTKYANKLGITDSLQFDGITTAPGSFDLKDAAESQIAWSGIGQHTDLINAAQFMTLMGELAGGGDAAEPYIMKQVSNGYEAKRQTVSVPLQQKTCEILTEYLRNNVITMYGQWHFPDLYVCAKSGTAELGPDEIPHATFSGFIQDANYPLAFIVIVENGGSGSATCAPIAGQVLKACCTAMDAER
ncbi:MAG: penicillin-binding protein [Oscillospiraceae bacterium]|nr:penicillin-binding protein [Oscillospiraceae bacterium]